MTDQILNEKQKIQEHEYKLPYHWFWRSNTWGGRVYWGYVNEIGRVADCLGRSIKFLDAGCGDGQLAYEIKKRGHNVWGFDYSEKAIGFAKLLAPTCVFDVFDIKKTSYKDNFFDVICLMEVLEHIEPGDIPAALSEMKRALRPRGVLVITVPSTLRPISKKHYQHFSGDGLAQLLERAGFKMKILSGQDKKSFVLYVWDKLTDNRIWQIKPLTSFFNLRIYPKRFNTCSIDSGKRIIAIAINP